MVGPLENDLFNFFNFFYEGNAFSMFARPQGYAHSVCFSG